PSGQTPGKYSAFQRIYDDYVAPYFSYQASEESKQFELIVKVGNKTLTVTNFVDFGTHNPGAVYSNIPPFVVTNTSNLPLKLYWTKGIWTSGSDTIPAASMTIVPAGGFQIPGGIGNFTNCTAQLTLNQNLPPGTYIATHTVWDDGNGNGTQQSTEASATFQTQVVVNPVYALDILQPTIDFGSVSRGNSVTKDVGFRNIGNASLTNFVWSFQDMDDAAAHMISAASISYTVAVPGTVSPNGLGTISVTIHVTDSAQPTGDYSGINQTLSGTGGSNDICTFMCRVDPGGVTGLASGTIYQKVATTTSAIGIGIPDVSLPPKRFILSAYVCPGSSSAALGFFETASPSKALVGPINSVTVDKSGNVTGSTSYEFGVTEAIPQFNSQHGETFKWYRLYIVFDKNFDGFTRDGFYILLQNLSDGTLASQSVWFDGVQIEEATYPDQTRPTRFGTGLKVISPNRSLELHGDKSYLEW
ncbi:MAG TPA: hypothetical protein PKM25_17150, partial [Candidatus Ozemobacteraceae bacterium]|nr:hypothetical protein [Candidatus Ozemobacteraceae bacterium]